MVDVESRAEVEAAAERLYGGVAAPGVELPVGDSSRSGVGVREGEWESVGVTAPWDTRLSMSAA